MQQSVDILLFWSLKTRFSSLIFVVTINEKVHYSEEDTNLMRLNFFIVLHAGACFQLCHNENCDSALHYVKGEVLPHSFVV